MSVFSTFLNTGNPTTCVADLQQAFEKAGIA